MTSPIRTAVAEPWESIGFEDFEKYLPARRFLYQQQQEDLNVRENGNSNEDDGLGDLPSVRSAIRSSTSLSSPSKWLASMRLMAADKKSEAAFPIVALTHLHRIIKHFHTPSFVENPLNGQLDVRKVTSYILWAFQNNSTASQTWPLTSRRRPDSL